MIIVNNYTINQIFTEVDNFRGTSCSIDLIALVDGEEFSSVIFNWDSDLRWGKWELNLSPTQSAPIAASYGLTASGLNLSYGEYKFVIKDNLTPLETGILWVKGQNNSIY